MRGCEPVLCLLCRSVEHDAVHCPERSRSFRAGGIDYTIDDRAPHNQPQIINIERCKNHLENAETA